METYDDDVVESIYMERKQYAKDSADKMRSCMQVIDNIRSMWMNRVLSDDEIKLLLMSIHLRVHSRAPLGIDRIDSAWTPFSILNELRRILKATHKITWLEKDDNDSFKGDTNEEIYEESDNEENYPRPKVFSFNKDDFELRGPQPHALDYITSICNNTKTFGSFIQRFRPSGQVVSYSNGRSGEVTYGQMWDCCVFWLLKWYEMILLCLELPCLKWIKKCSRLSLKIYKALKGLCSNIEILLGEMKNETNCRDFFSKVIPPDHFSVHSMSLIASFSDDRILINKLFCSTVSA